MKEVYRTLNRSIPAYISALANPMRKRHKDDLLVTESTVKPSATDIFNLYLKDELYNAWEEDIAVVNIFFGKDTVMGDMNLKYNRSSELFVEFERSIRMGPVDFVASLGGLFGLCLGFSIISFLEIIYWVLASIYKTSFNKM